jgi:hypothetical protein
MTVQRRFDRSYFEHARSFCSMAPSDMACAGFGDTKLPIFLGPEVSHGETKVYSEVQV